MIRLYGYPDHTARYTIRRGRGICYTLSYKAGPQHSLREFQIITNSITMPGNASLIAPIPDYKVFRRHFCCCIPVRAGVIVSALFCCHRTRTLKLDGFVQFFGLLGLLGGASVAAIGIINITRHGACATLEEINFS